MSSGQQRLWFLDQFEGPDSTYNAPFPLRLRGPLDRPALREAVSDVAVRHEVLRTIFPATGGTPSQLVLDTAELPCRLVYEEVEIGEDALPEALAAAAARPFDLAAEIPYRATLFVLGPRDHVLLLLLHHIACDGWSLGPLAADLGAAYAARLESREPDWEPLEVQYADYAEWQHEVLGDEADPDSLAAEQLAYWREQLAGVPERLRLPVTYRAEQPEKRTAGNVTVDVPAGVHAALLDLVRAERCTLFMGLHATLAALLARMGAGADVVLGTPVAGRDEPALAGLVGFFVNTLALRTDVGGDPGFRELLARARETDLAAYAHQDIPFERVVDALGADRASGVHPLFQVMTVLQNNEEAGFALPGLDVRVQELDLAAAKFDLSVAFAERRAADGTPAGIECQFEYATDLADCGTAARWAAWFGALLGRLVTEPDAPLSGLEVADADGIPLGADAAAPVNPKTESNTIAEDDFRAPRTAVEEILCGLFADVLGLAEVGVHDNFFALGGYSLLATRLTSRVRAALGAEIRLRELFRNPTPAGVAVLVAAAGDAAPRPPLVPAPRPDPLPLSYAQQRLWFLAGVEGQDRAYNVPLILRLAGGVDRAALAAALADVVARHESLRTVFPATEGRPRQEIRAAGSPLEVVECDRAELDRLVHEASAHRFDLAAETALRARLFVVGERESVLVLCLHHIASDGWSMGPLFADLAAAYAARVEGREPGLAPLPLQYADYALWQRELLGSEDNPDSLVSAQLAFWRERLAGIPEELALPFDRPRPAVAGHRAGSVTAPVSAATHRALTALARESGATLFMVAQAALAVLLSRLGAGPDVPLGTPVAGRAEEQLDELVGFFVNTLVLRTDTGGDPTFRDLVARVREADLAAFSHQDLPFDRLVEHLNPARSLARHPLFQVMFSLAGGSGASDTSAWTLPGLTVSVEDDDTASAVAKFDLAVTVAEQHGAGPEGLACRFDFAADVLEDATVGRWARWFARLLDGVAADPDRPVWQIEVAEESDLALLESQGADGMLTHVGRFVDASQDADEVPPLDADELDRGPRDTVEEILCGLFADVLGLESVGVHDNFFALGGYSMLATRLAGRIRSALATEAGIRTIFEAPTVAGLAARLDPGRAVRPALLPAERPDPLPLSFAQQRLWFISRLDQDGTGYNAPVALRLRGPLDRDAMTAAVADVVGRHEVLRTVFPEIDGAPVQRILDAWRPDTEVRACSEAGLEAAVDAFAQRPFDLTAEPPFRAVLLALGETDHVLVMALHHIASDGGSMGPLCSDVAAAYTARAAGTAPTWTPLPVQYADYTLWQRELLGPEDDADSLVSAQLAYWREKLAVLPEELSLPYDRPRPAVRTHHGDSVPWELPAEVHRRLAAVARESGATLFMVMQAALATVLSRLGAGPDIPLGTPTAGRTDENLDRLVGFFVNTLVLRTDVSGDLGFRELLARVRETDLAAYTHQDLPFDRLVEELNPVRSLARHPLFQVSVVEHGGDADGAELVPGLVAESLPADTAAVRFDLSLAFSASADAEGAGAGLHGVLAFATELFDTATIESLAGRLLRLLTAVAEDPDAPVHRIDLLTADERERVLRGWNATDVEVADTTLPELFAVQAAATPDAVAVVFEGAEVSYRAFDGMVEALARALRAEGVRPADVVAVALPRSVELVAALHAVHRVGAAYLPVDPGYPADRVEFMLQDARPATVLTPESVAELLARGAELDGEGFVPVPSSYPAYVIYTSGSTGRPKGVMVSHAAIVTHMFWMQGDYPLGADDRVLQKTPSSFDVSVWEFFWPLMTGAALVVARPDGHRDPAYLAELIRERQVTVAHFVPAMLDAFLNLPEATADSPLRQLFCGGEALPPALARRCAAALPGTRLSNFYGPTEAAVEATHQPYSPDVAGRTVPIGRPVWNTRAYVLDAWANPVPAGVPAELYLAGDQLADGYLHRAGLTAQRFVPDPFGGPGARLYRTGDLVRWTPDGAIEYLGRTDDQVKIRGQRLEPGEIAAVARECAGVEQAVVVVREDRPGDRRLVAYVVGPAEPAAVRAYLAAALPEYMVPAAVVTVEALPLSPNGKVDRRALPAPEFTTDADTYRAPRDAVEEIMCGLFAELLGVERVGADDGFFDLGGHSLLAVRLISRVRTALGAELAVRDLFQAPTPAGLAALAGQAVGSGGGSVRAALRPMDRPEQLPLSFAQQRLWFGNRLDGTDAGYTVPIALRLRGVLDVAALASALADVVARHEVLRTVFPEIDGRPVQRVLPAPDPELPLRSVAEAELPRLLDEAAATTFDLTAQTPFRTELLEVGPEDHVLLLVMHHIASDGWSMGPLCADLASAYSARLASQEPDWAPLPVQYADYALWQREVLGDEEDPDSEIAAQLAFWGERLAGMPDELALPFDRPRPAVPGRRGEAVALDVPADVHRALAGLARECGATMFMTVQAALAALLSRLGAGTDIPLGTATAGRSDEALDGLIGFFVNTLVLRTDVGGDPTFRELLARVRETDLAAFSHQDLPFDRLVEHVNPVRTLARHPLFQVMYVLQNNEEGSLDDLPGLRVDGMPGQGRSLEFDLVVSVRERRDAAGGADGLGGTLVFNADLFDAATAASLTARLARWLGAAAAEPDVPIGRLPLLTAAERRHLLVTLTDTGLDIGEPVAVSELVAAHAVASPAAAAVVCGGAELDYATLDASADRLAALLAEAGVVRGDMVGICMPRCTDLVVAMLAVLRVGAAYLPLDPAYPADRIDFILGDACAPVVLTQAALAERVSAAKGSGARRVVCLDTEAAALAARPRYQAPVAPTPGDAAYVIYTSGSTGLPKGVVVEHRGLTDLCAWTRHEFGVTAADRASQVAALGFDAAVWEIWPALSAGAAVHLATEEALGDGPALAGWLADSGISVCFLPTPRLEALLDEPAIAGRWPRVVFTGGDRLRRRPAGEPGFRLVNAYGPTEFSVVGTAGDVAPAGRAGLGGSVDRAGLAGAGGSAGAASSVGSAGSAGTGRALPDIGVPVANTRAYVLDAAMNPVPVGVPGELHLAGAGLARGYLGRSGMTGQRFVPDPFGAPGERMYRTGDMVRWRADGRIDFIGRTDHQVKVRGVRIELGEIDAVLGSFGGVRQVATIVREDRPGIPELVAYVVGEPGLEIAELHRHAAAFLPTAMVPAAFVALEAMPLTPNGKLDPAALPAPDRSGAGTGRAPRGPRERVLCELFSEVLGVPEVTIDDDFFALGGHSLLAARLSGLIRRELGTELGIKVLFDAPTVALLAERLGSGTATGTPRDSLAVLLPLRGRGAAAPLFCVHPAVGVGWVYSGLLAHLDPERPVYALQARGLTEPDRRPATVSEMVKDYLDQIVQVQPEGPYHLLGWSFGAEVAHAMAVRLQQRGQEVASLTMLDGYPGGSLSARAASELNDQATSELSDQATSELSARAASEQTLAELLVSLGHDLGDVPEGHVLDQAEFVARVRAAGGPLAEFGAAELEALPAVFAANRELAMGYEPEVFRGDVLFFQATEGKSASSPAPGDWRPFVTGEMTVVPVGYRHGELTRPDAIGEIGRVIAAG